MGVIETIKQYTRKDGMEIGAFLAGLECKIDFLNRCEKWNFSNEDLVEMINVELSFVQNFKENCTKEKVDIFLKVIDQNDEVEQLEELVDVKRFFIKKMADFGFSKLALVEYFKMENKKIEEIINEK